METANLNNDHHHHQHHQHSPSSDSLDFASKTLLSWIAILDNHGAHEWNLHIVAVTTAIFLLMVRLVLHQKRGIDWYALLHAIVSGGASLAIVYLNFFAAENLTGVAEPLRSITCQGPLTSLHRVLPAITMGYALFDLLDGVSMGLPDFIFHGAATFCMMAFFVEQDIPEVVAPYLIMEVSTIFLTMVRADFFTSNMTMMTQALFVLNFFIFRIVLVPVLWLELLWTMYSNTQKQRRGTDESSCLDSSALPVMVGGLLFHMLNCFWFVKIVKKVRRKLSGKEDIQSNNDLKDDNDNSSTLSKDDDADDLPALRLADSDLDQSDDTPEKKKQN
jgi:TLC domain